VCERQQERGSTIFFAFVGWSKVVEEDDTEAADELGKLEGQSAIAVA
jgi:hypothetical protein